MGLFSLEKLFGITIRESATDGSDFTNPDADYRRLFLGEDGQLHVKDSAGAVTDIGGAGTDVATDAIWDAAGDLAVGTGANTAAKLTKGATGTVPTAGASTLAYAYPPGYEFAYVEFTAGVTISATTEATANEIVSAGAVSFDGSTTVMIEFFSNDVVGPAINNDQSISIWLYDGSSSIGQWSFERLINGGTHHINMPQYLRRRLTPSNASHTYSARASVSSSTGTVDAGAGGSGNVVPGYIRITKV